MAELRQFDSLRWSFHMDSFFEEDEHNPIWGTVMCAFDYLTVHADINKQTSTLYINNNNLQYNTTSKD